MSSALKTLLALLFTLCYYHLFAQQQSFKAIEKSLFKQLEQANKRQDSIDIYNNIAYNYRRTSPEKIKQYANLAIELSHTISYTNGLAKAQKNKGIYYYKLGTKQDSAILSFELAIEYANQVEDYYTIAACKNNIGLIQTDNLEFDKAITGYLTTISIIDSLELDAHFLHALVLGNMGTAYRNKGDHFKAIDFFSQALEIADKHDEKLITSIYLDEIGVSYSAIGKEDEALKMVKKALDIHTDLGDHQSMVETLLRYSKIELQRKNFQSALEHTQKAYDICNTHGILLLYHDVLVRFAECYLGLGKITQAEEFANTALENLGSKNSLLEKRNTFQVLSDINAAKKEYKSAHYYLQKTKEVQDTIHNEQAVFLSNRMAAKYDNEQKVSKIKELESDREYQKNWIVSLTIFLLSTALLLIAIFCFYQRSKNLVRELNKKNKEITSQSEELQQLSQLKDKLFSTISHDLKNPIAHFEQGIQYLLSDELPKEEFLVFAKELKENATQLRKSVNKLMNWSYMQMVGLQPKATRNSLYKTAESSIDFYQKIGDDKRVTFKNNVPASLFVEFDEEHLGSIIRNLTSNAIKFSYQEGSIVFSAYQKENQIIFSIKDYGRGIEKEKLKEVFRAGFTTWGTDGEKGTGLGLALCKEFVEQNGGSIWVESDLGKGSTFFVAFPVITANTSPQSFALSKAAL